MTNTSGGRALLRAVCVVACAWFCGCAERPDPVGAVSAALTTTRTLPLEQNCNSFDAGICNTLLLDGEVCATTTCMPSGACQINSVTTLADGGTACQTATRACEQASFCSGASFTCPATTRVSRDAGLVCRPAAAAVPYVVYEARDGGYPDGTYYVNDGGTIVVNTTPYDTTCDRAETCDGTSFDCPSDTFQPTTVKCRTYPSTGNDHLCVQDQYCSGSSARCPAPMADINGSVCDQPASNANQADAGFGQWRPGFCAGYAYCQGGTFACPLNNNYKPVGHSQIAECGEYSCVGTNSWDWNFDGGFLAEGTRCNNGGSGETRPCDLPDYCTGTGPRCPDRIKAAGEICRAASGPCDAVELCPGTTNTNIYRDDAGVGVFTEDGGIRYFTRANGSASADPAKWCRDDFVQTAGTSCRAAAGVCDNPELCDGVAKTCPAEGATGYADAGIVCRPAADGGCDIQETCTGASPECPSDTFQASGTQCAAALTGAPCDLPDECNGSGTCVPTFADDSTICRASAADPTCDPAEYCTGDDVSCPADSRDTTSLMCQVQAAKPHILLMVDNSGSMVASTGTGQNACDKEHTRMSDVKCAVKRMVQTFGEVTFGLGRFALNNATGTASAGSGSCLGGSGTYVNTCTTCPNTSVAGTCSGCTFDSSGTGCSHPSGTDTEAEILVGINDTLRSQIVKWVDYSASSNTSTSCNAYSASPTWNPELVAQTDATPLASSLKRAYTYYAGGTDATGAGYSSDETSACQRRYVILLTDGQESCASNHAAADAATALQSVDVGGGNHVSVDTYVILFGDTDSDHLSSANAIATAGGTDHARSASNDVQLSNVLSEILQEAIPREICNGEDDDCDGVVDNGLTCFCDRANGVFNAILPTNPGDSCDSAHVDNNCYRGTADEMCSCTVTGLESESCSDGIDNDCDGATDSADLADCGTTCDEGISRGYVGQPEICNGFDEDCDLTADEDIGPRDCGMTRGACIAGTQYCVGGAWTTCSDRRPADAEDCDDGPGQDPTSAENDDDCDGVVDTAEGIYLDCGPKRTVIVDTDTGETAEEALTQGICRQGRRACGSTECVGAQAPMDGPDVCDGLDTDCDGETDEDFVSEICSCGEGTGMSTCSGGSIGCRTSATLNIIDDCDSLDNDCDGDVDEDADTATSGDHVAPDCVNGEHFCVAPHAECMRGVWNCVGEVPALTERCDNIDNNCMNGNNEEPDSDAGADAGRLCGDEFRVECGNVDIRGGFDCRKRCDGSDEFECGDDQLCYIETGRETGYCISDECKRLHVGSCPRSSMNEVQQCDPLDGVCKPACASGLVDTCSTHFACNPQSGTCQPLCGGGDAGAGTFCGLNEICADGECVASTMPDAGMRDAALEDAAEDMTSDAYQPSRVSAQGGCAGCAVGNREQNLASVFWLMIAALFIARSRTRKAGAR